MSGNPKGKSTENGGMFELILLKKTTGKLSTLLRRIIRVWDLWSDFDQQRICTGMKIIWSESITVLHGDKGRFWDYLWLDRRTKLLLGSMGVLTYSSLSEDFISSPLTSSIRKTVLSVNWSLLIVFFFFW